MSEWLFVSAAIVAVLVVVGILLTLVLWKKRKEVKLEETNYRAFFIMGIAFFPTGLVFMIISFLSDISFVIGLPLFSMGLIYLIIGLANRDKWKKNE